MSFVHSIILAWLFVVSGMAAAMPELPDMGSPSDTVLSPDEEKQLGDAFYRNLHQQVRISQDPEIQDYIASLGGHLVAHSEMADRSFHFFVVMEPEINAFAGPAGYIGVHSGLILASESEGELASVLAHEIAHVTQRHLQRAFGVAKRMTLPMAAASLAAILLGTQVPELGQAALVALQAGSMQHQINFTRKNEQEADRIGLRILAESDFDPRSMPAFFERLQQSTRFLGRDIPEFLRTHPVTSSRIADTRARANDFPYHQYTDSLGYLLTKAKLKVLTATDQEELESEFKSLMARGTDLQRAAARYGLALTRKAQNQLESSRQLFLELMKDFPGQPQFIHGMAETELALNQTDKALSRYRIALERFPASWVLKLEYAGALLDTGHFQDARILLQPMVIAPEKVQPILLKLLSRTYAGLDKQAEAQRYLAEYHYALGDLDKAIAHAELAAKMAREDRILKAVAEERLRYFRAEDKARKR
ncbi:MAG: M48 family metalloprotease [Methylohalobius sp. ZOD2]